MNSGDVFHYHVRDREEHKYIVMELFYTHTDHGNVFTVHYPQFEFAKTKLNIRRTCFVEFYSWQVAMMIFAYGEEEYRRFEEAFTEWARKKNEQEINAFDTQWKEKIVKEIGDRTRQIEASELPSKEDLLADNKMDIETLRRCCDET